MEYKTVALGLGLPLLASACFLRGPSIASPSAQPSLQQNQDTPSQPALPPPPVEAFKLASDYESFTMQSSVDQNDTVNVDLSFETYKKTVHMDFIFSEIVNGIQSPIIRESIPFPVSYYPTSAIYIGSDKVAVAGMVPSTGLAKIEVWQLTKPAVYKIPNQSGEISYFVRGSAASSVSTGFAPLATAEFGLVRAMWRSRSLGGEHVIVQNHIDKDLFTVDLATTNATRIASPSEAVGAQAAVAPLADNWLGYEGPARHSTAGDIYILTRVVGVELPPDQISDLYMIDSDLNGVPDQFIPMSEDLLDSSGLGDLTEWEFDWQ